MKFRSLLWILLALFLVNSFAEDKNRRRQELADEAEISKFEETLKIAMTDLEKVKVKRWQDKRNAIARKEAFSEAWDDIRREMDQLSQKKAQKEGTQMRLDNQVQQMETEMKAQEDRQKEFGIILSEKAGELSRLLKSGFPVKNEREMSMLKKIQDDLEARGFRPTADVITSLFSRQKDRYLLGESREIVREQFTFEKVTPADPAANMVRSVPNTPGVLAGYMVRIGLVYRAFVSTETPDVAILAKSGSLGDKPWVWLENIQENTKEDLRKVKAAVLSGDSAAIALLPIDVILRKSTGSGYSADDEKSFMEGLIEEWIGAGFVIWFMLAIEIVAIFIILEKLYLALFRSMGSRRLYNKIKALLEKGDTEGALALSRKKKTGVANVLTAILERAGGKRQEAEDAAIAVLLHEQPIFERNVNTINILAAAAPLVGLLGTVSGMINLFSAITMHGTNDPKIMAAGIAEALLATKWALIVALPLMLIYNMTLNAMGKVVSDMEKYAASTLNQIFIGKGND